MRGQGTVRISDTHSMGRFMNPYVPPMHLVYMDGIKVIDRDKSLIDEHVVFVPVRMPAPTAPSAPSEKHAAYENLGAPPTPVTKGRRWRIIPRRIRIPIGSGAPNPGGIVIRHVNDIRTGRLNINHRMSVFRRIRHRLLFGRFKLASVLGSDAHILNRIHDARLIRQECVSKIGGPRNVLVHALEYAGEGNERLNARVPALFLSGTGQVLSFEFRVLLRPLIRLNDFKGIGGRHEDLAYQFIGI